MTYELDKFVFKDFTIFVRGAEMSKRGLISLLASIGQISALMFTSCATPKPEVIEKTVTETIEVDRVHSCLNPHGDFVPLELHNLAG